MIRLPGDMYHGVCSEAILSQPVLLSLEGVLMRSLSSYIQSDRLTSLVNYTLNRALHSSEQIQWAVWLVYVRKRIK